MPDMRLALVLGPGGVIGTAWIAGSAGRLRGRGLDLARADLIVGTSAGAIVGAMVTGGRDLEEPAEPQDGGGLPEPEADPALPAEVFAENGG